MNRYLLASILELVIRLAGVGQQRASVQGAPQAPPTNLSATHHPWDNGEVLGWYLYYEQSGEGGQVLQMVARRGSAQSVLRCLYRRARSRGVVALQGRLNPSSFWETEDRHRFYSGRGPWTLIQSNEPQVLSCFQQGNACFSRLEGEWSLRFRLT